MAKFTKQDAFAAFDEGKKPSDLKDKGLSNKSLYNYFGLWKKDRKHMDTEANADVTWHMKLTFKIWLKKQNRFDKYTKQYRDKLFLVGKKVRKTWVASETFNNFILAFKK